MSLWRVRIRDIEHVVVVAAAFVLIISLWHRLSVTSDIRTLSKAQKTVLREQSERPLVFPGNYPDTVVFFLDYRCPYCAVLYSDMVRDDARYGIVVRHVVANRNTLSAQAAVAAECARREGKFHAFSYALFARRDSIGLLSWQEFATAAGVPELDSLSQCIEYRTPIDVIEDDTELAQQLGLTGTPVAIYAALAMGSTMPLSPASRAASAIERAPRTGRSPPSSPTSPTNA